MKICLSHLRHRCDFLTFSLRMESSEREARCLKILHALGVRRYKKNYRGDLSSDDGVYFVDYHGTLTLNLSSVFFDREDYMSRLSTLRIVLESFSPALTRVDSAHDFEISSKHQTAEILEEIFFKLDTRLKSVLYFGKSKQLETISISTALCGVRIYDRAAAAVHFKKVKDVAEVGKVIRVEAFLRTRKAIPEGDWLVSGNALQELTCEVDKTLFLATAKRKNPRVALPDAVSLLVFEAA